MLSDKLIWSVERHADVLEKQWARMIQEHPATASYHTLDDEELEGTIREVYRHLGEYIEEAHNSDQMAQLFINIGRQRRKQGVPLHELIFAITLARRNILNFITEEETFLSALAWHQVNEFWYRIMSFFDENIYFVLLGYNDEVDDTQRMTDQISKFINAFTLGALPEIEKDYYSH
ncbi:MAG: histidine kinase N-terminal domain-containing protein [Calditrichota bacterium]